MSSPNSASSQVPDPSMAAFTAATIVNANNYSDASFQAPSVLGDAAATGANITDSVVLDPSIDEYWTRYKSFGVALLSSYTTTFQSQNPLDALDTRHPEVSRFFSIVHNWHTILDLAVVDLYLQSERAS